MGGQNVFHRSLHASRVEVVLGNEVLQPRVRVSVVSNEEGNHGKEAIFPAEVWGGRGCLRRGGPSADRGSVGALGVRERLGVHGGLGCLEGRVRGVERVGPERCSGCAYAGRSEAPVAVEGRAASY